MLLPVIALLVFLAVALVTFEVMRPREDPVARRVAGHAASPVPPARAARTAGSLRQRVLGPAFGQAGRLLARLLPQHWVRGVERMLVMANEPWSLPGFLGVWALSVWLGTMLALYVLSSLEVDSTWKRVAFTMPVMAFSALLPYARLRNLARKRRKAIIRALPDAMDLLTTSVEAGLGVDAAFAMVAEKTQGPLSETFSLYLRQVGLGRSRQEALVHVAQRTGVDDLVTIAHNVNQGSELGTPLGDVLRQQAEELRVLRRQRAQLAAQRAPILMTIPMSLCFLPAMVAVVVVPSVLNLMNFVTGLGK